MKLGASGALETLPLQRVFRLSSLTPGKGLKTRTITRSITHGTMVARVGDVFKLQGTELCDTSDARIL